MPDGPISRVPKQRETRRSVVLPARLRADRGWGDACILNLSSKGMLVYSAAEASPGAYIELRRGTHAIVARVVWRSNNRMGLCSQDLLPVDEVIRGSPLQQARTPELGIQVAVRRTERRYESSRARARTVQFLSITLVAAALASVAYATVAETLSRPLAQVASILRDG